MAAVDVWRGVHAGHGWRAFQGFNLEAVVELYCQPLVGAADSAGPCGGGGTCPELADAGAGLPTPSDRAGYC